MHSIIYAYIFPGSPSEISRTQILVSNIISPLKEKRFLEEMTDTRVYAGRR
jgi:hypothetical protein